MKKTAITFLAFLFATPVLAADHLEPEDSSFVLDHRLWLQPYNDMVLTKFQSLYDRDVVATMVAIPSFSPEYGVGLANRGHDWRVVVLEPAIHLWAYEVMDKDAIREAKLPADWHDVAVDRCEQPLEPMLAARIANLWVQMLSRTRFDGTPPKWTADGPVHGTIETVGVDGEIYHFTGGGWAGKTWSPSKDTPPGMLVGIATAMVAYCRHNDAKALATIEQTTAALERRLTESP